MDRDPSHPVRQESHQSDSSSVAKLHSELNLNPGGRGHSVVGLSPDGWDASFQGSEAFVCSGNQDGPGNSSLNKVHVRSCCSSSGWQNTNVGKVNKIEAEAPACHANT